MKRIDLLKEYWGYFSQKLDEPNFARFVELSQQPVRKSIRVNTLKISVDAFCARVRAQGWQLSPVPWCGEGFWLTRPLEQEQAVPLGSTPEHMCGLFYSQEAGSMLPPVALLAGREKVSSILDMAAAPGSKTTQLAAMMGEDTLLLANDPSASRLKGLHANLLRCGAPYVGLMHYDAVMIGEWAPEEFEAILLDAPCSGTGTIRRDPSVADRWALSQVPRLAHLQKRLIVSAFHALKPGGCLVYSTCTMTYEENQQVCEHLLKQFQGNVVVEPLGDLFPGAATCATQEGFLQLWPYSFDQEGFFVARFRKLATENLPVTHTFKPRMLDKLPPRRYQQLYDYYLRHFGFTLPMPKEQLVERDQTVWWLPWPPASLPMGLRWDRLGMKLATRYGEDWRTEHEMIMRFGQMFTQHVKALSLQEWSEYIQGKDLIMNEKDEGDCLLSYQGYPIGLGRYVGNRIKNRLPREWVRSMSVL